MSDPRGTDNDHGRDAQRGFARRAGSAKCCERELRKCGKAFSGFNREGESWVCPKCETLWTYLEDESEGGSWYHNDVWAEGSPNVKVSDGSGQ